MAAMVVRVVHPHLAAMSLQLCSMLMAAAVVPAVLQDAVLLAAVVEVFLVLADQRQMLLVVLLG